MQTKVNGSSFKIKRPLITTHGFSTDVDATVKLHLGELNDLLGKRIFPGEGSPGGEAPADGGGATGAGTPRASAGTAPPSGSAAERERRGSILTRAIKELLRKPLRPRLIGSKTTPWPEGSLAYTLHREQEAPDKLTLADYIDRTPELSELKYSVQECVLGELFSIDYNTKAVLEDYPALADYLLAFAYHVMDIEEIHGLKNFFLNNRLGAKNVAVYAAVSAARTIIDKEQIKVDGLNSDDSELINAIEAAGLTLSTASFKPALRSLINDLIFNSKESKLIDEANVGKLPAGIKPLLIKFLKSSPVPIDKDNIKFFLPLFISQAHGTTALADLTEADAEEADKDFDVLFLEDDQSLIQVSTSAVKCAAQLYYGMVLGDELDVFEAMNFFSHKFLLREAIEIQDSRLRDDLQLYVFSNKYVDLKTKKIVDRTRPAERQMFYRQVFNQGKGQVSGDLVVINHDFPRLWKLLILESANYLERARESFNPDGYVSKQNVMQAVEDIQYNLSTHCTGMANVVTPLIYAELDFIIRRIFMHPEILRQVVPSGGTWWRVVETLYLAMRRSRPKATVLYNKAKLGHEILRAIATYNPSTFDNDENFSRFISNVDAFITTQSILQAALVDDLKKGDQEGETEHGGYGSYGNGANGVNGAHAAAPPPGDGMEPAGPEEGAGAEWDF